MLVRVPSIQALCVLKCFSIFSSNINSAVNCQSNDIDWFALAADVAKRKFGFKSAQDQKAKAKRVRFMQYRGFNFEQIKYALSVSEHDED